MWDCPTCGSTVEDESAICRLCGTSRDRTEPFVEPSQPVALEDGDDAATAETGSAPLSGPLRIERPVASGMSVLVWILAVFAFFPVLGSLPSLVLALCSAFVLLRPTELAWDRRIGIGGLLVALISLSITALWVLMLVVSPGEKVVQVENMGAPPDPGWGVTAVQLVVLVISIVLHECAHGVSALWSGDGTAARHGRLRLNPLAHVDPFGSVVLPAILAMTASGFVIGWAKPVPIDRRQFRHPRRGLLAVTLAGVSVNMLLALLCTSGLLAVGCGLRIAYPEGASQGFTNLLQPVQLQGVTNAATWEWTIVALKQGLLINVVLFSFNILPIPPLDGYGVLESLTPRFLAPMVAALRPWGSILLIVLIVSGMLFYLLIPGFIAGILLNGLAGWLTGWA